MIITSYYQAIKQINFDDEGEKRELLNTFSQSLAEYVRDPNSGTDAKLTGLNSFYFSLPYIKDPKMATNDMAAIAKVNQEVLEMELDRIFSQQGISQSVPVKFEVDKFGRLAASGHPQAGEINKILSDHPELAERMKSALKDAAIVAHQAHLDQWKYEFNEPYSGATKKAMLQERDRFVVPDTQFVMLEGEIATTFSDMDFQKWMQAQKAVLADLIGKKEAEQLTLLSLI